MMSVIILSVSLHVRHNANARYLSLNMLKREECKFPHICFQTTTSLGCLGIENIVIMVYRESDLRMFILVYAHNTVRANNLE